MDHDPSRKGAGLTTINRLRQGPNQVRPPLLSHALSALAARGRCGTDEEEKR